MTSVLPIDAADLLNGRTESARLEFKASWDPKTTGAQVVKTICAFANDFRTLVSTSMLAGSEQHCPRIREAWGANESSAALATELIRRSADRDDLDAAGQVFERFRVAASGTAAANVSNVWAEILLDHDRVDDALDILREVANVALARDAVDAAILARRLRDARLAHRYFEQAGDAMQTDPRALHEFAQTKMWLAQEARRGRRRAWQAVNRRLLIEARHLLERVLQMDGSDTRHAWAWRDLARVLNWLGLPAKETEAAFANAIDLLPAEPRFEEELRQFRERSAGRRARGGNRSR